MGPRCASKVRHPSAAAARAAARSLGDGCEAFHCKFCLGWHVGHTNPKIERNKRSTRIARYKKRRAKKWRGREE